MIATPVFAPSTLNCTLATATLSDAVAVTFTVPESVAFAAGDVTETLGATVSATVVDVMSTLVTEFPPESVDRARKWYIVPGFRPDSAT